MDKLKQEVEELRSEILALAEKPGDLDDTEAARYDAALAEFDAKRPQLEAAEARAEKVAAVRSFVVPQAGAPTVERSQAPAVVVKRSAEEVLEDRSTTGRERTRQLADALLRANESKAPSGREDQVHFEAIVKRHASDHRWAQNILARSTDVYADAFAKVVTGREMLLDNEERAAVAIGTATQGGVLVPTHLDPTVMLTNAGSSNVMRAANTRKVTLTEGNVWYGVTSAGSTASWDGELVEVSDDTPAFASTSITCYKAQAFVQASVEAFQDIAGLQGDLLAILADAKDRLEGTAHMTGSGSAPQGLFTLVCGSTTLRTTSTTAATIGEVDIHALYRALPVRFRSRGTFVMNPLYALAIKRLGTSVSSAFSGDLTQPVTDRILGRPLLESDDAPTTQTTTALDQEIVFADLSQYTIVDKPGGVAIQYVPTLFNTANNLPDGRSGWHMYWRTGAGMPVLQGGVWLADKTSA